MMGKSAAAWRANTTYLSACAYAVAFRQFLMYSTFIISYLLYNISVLHGHLFIWWLDLALLLNCQLYTLSHNIGAPCQNYTGKS